MRDRVILVCLLAMTGVVHAQVLTDQPGLDTRFEEDQRLETDTALGRFTIGVSGLSENEKLAATTGDVELGYLYQYEFDSTFPRVIDLRPFLFNRAESSESSYYESLGVGAGVRLSWRKKYEEKNWFARLSTLTPTDAYRERYDLDRNLSTIVELFVGYEIPFVDAVEGRAMRKRVTPPSMIELAIPPELFDASASIDAGVIKRIHPMIIGAYLVAVERDQDRIAPRPSDADRNWPAVELIQRATQEDFPEARWAALHIDVIEDAEVLAERRRELVADYLRQGLITMMRGPYPLLLKPTKPEAGEAIAPATKAYPVGQIAYPGMRVKPGSEPLDADRMIEDYVELMTSRIR